MEKTTQTLSRNYKETQVKKEQLMTEAFRLSDRNGKPALRLWILLSRQPDVSTGSLENLVEKGLLDMEISLEDPYLLLNDGNESSVRKTELQLFNEKSDTIIHTLNGFGSRPVFRFQIMLTVEECLEFRKALTDAASYIHLKGYVIFQDKDTETEVRFQLPFRKLLNQAFMHLSKEEKENFISIRYFDPLNVNYKDAPVFITNRILKSRSTSLALTKLVKVKNGAVNPLTIVQPAIAKFTLSSNPGTSINLMNKLWYMDDLKINADPGSHIPSLPVVTDNEDMVWTDSVNGKKLWYLPEYAVIDPVQSDSPSDSSFLLTLEKIGSEANGRAVLKGEVRISLSLKIPKAAAMKAGNISGSQLVPVEIQSQTFRLQLPFIEKNDPKTTDISPSEVTVLENVVRLTFLLTDEWIRNCYGVLSINDFQKSRAGIKVFTCFKGISKVQKKNIKLLHSAGFLKLDLVKSNQIMKAASFNIENRTLIIGDEELKFPDNLKSRGQLLKPKFAAKLSMSAKSSVANILEAKPGTKLPQAETGEELAERSFGKEQTMEVFFPCGDFGQFYTEESSGTSRMIGCFEPYRLGEISFRMYEESAALATPFYKVHRSLQSPDHFLVQPSAYRITRFDAFHPEFAFKACVHLYGAIDEADDFQNSICVLDMSLEPDISPYEFHLLKQELRRQCNKSPVIEFPGEVMEDVVFNWSLPPGMKVTTLNIGRTVQMTVTVDIMEVLTLQAMLKNGVLKGRAVYTMKDKTEYAVNLDPDTVNIAGPWENGPLEIKKDNNTVTFINGTERTVLFSKVIRSDTDDKDLETFSINKNLLPGESVSVSTTNTRDNFIPDCIAEPTAVDLEESWVFIDDLYCQVIFSTDIDFGQRRIDGIDIEASFADNPLKAFSGRLTPGNPVAEFENYISLTKIAGPRMISFRIRTVASDNVSEFSGLKQWSVKEQGNIINITSDFLV